MLRLSMGKGSEFLNHSLTLSSIVALISGGLAVTNLSSSFFQTGIPAAYTPLITSLASELQKLLLAWMLPAAVLLVFSSFIVGLRSAQLMDRTGTILRYAGSSPGLVIRLMAVRLLVLSLSSWLFGWVGGLVISQLSFRFISIATGSPYLIPFLYPGDLMILALITFLSVFAGNSILLLSRRGAAKNVEAPLP